MKEIIILLGNFLSDKSLNPDFLARFAVPFKHNSIDKLQFVSPLTAWSFRISILNTPVEIVSGRNCIDFKEAGLTPARSVDF